MNGGLNVEICDSDLNCCNAGSLDSDRDDFNKAIFGFCLRDYWFRSTPQSDLSVIKFWSWGRSYARATGTCSTVTWSMAARTRYWRRAPLSSLSLTMGLMAGRVTGSGSCWMAEPTSSVRWDSCWMTSRVPISHVLRIDGKVTSYICDMYCLIYLIK